MISTLSYAALSAGTPLVSFSFERRDPGPREVLIEILFCGVCHSDIHSVRDEWGRGSYPMVPGHEIVGRVLRAGEEVRRFHVGDAVGVGCFVDSCRRCSSCREGSENYCEQGPLFTYNATDATGQTTRGGYSSHIVVDENYVLRIPAGLALERAAPLLCAGITTYSPLRHWKVGRGHRLGVVGLGGLGHMAVKWGRSLGAETTVLSTSASKKEAALRLGATDFLLTQNAAALSSVAHRFDFIIDTVSAVHDLNALLALLKRDGTMVVVGAPGEPVALETFSLIFGRKNLTGSLIGGIKETQAMLDYGAQVGVQADVEVIPVSRVNEAYERVLRGDVRYRFVLDMKTLT